jgi:PhzF family phenazine biosynthesis protein
MNETKVLHFDVFTSQPGKGNPAGIVLLPEELDSNQMQRIATSVGFNDTAFILYSDVADFAIRYFSPRKEVDLCGHATVAAATALHRAKLLPNAGASTFTFQTKAGVLPIKLEPLSENEVLVKMSQALSQFREFKGDKGLVMEVIGLTQDDIHPELPIMYGSTGRWTLLVPTCSLDAMQRMQPRTARFPEVIDIPGASIHPFCIQTIGKEAHLHARHFSAPGSGTVEDPVTGTASGVLGAYYHEFLLTGNTAPEPIIIEQGYEMGREGRVLVWAEKHNDSYAVRIAGIAVFVNQFICEST